jgi:hypothetical protein
LKLPIILTDDTWVTLNRCLIEHLRWCISFIFIHPTEHRAGTSPSPQPNIEQNRTMLSLFILEPNTTLRSIT